MKYRSKLDVMVAFAENLATLSKCEQRGVAAILTDRDFRQIYSCGTNGGPSRGAQCLCVLPGKYGCIHAEINCLIKCQVPTEEKVMIVTLSPCIQCAAAIINAGISRVYYTEEYKDKAGINMLAHAGIQCLHYARQ